MLGKLSFLPKTVSFVSISISFGILSIIINAILFPIVWSEISSVWKEFDLEIQEFKDLETLVTLELARFPVEVKRKTREEAQDFVLNDGAQPNRKHRKIIKRIVHRTNKIREDEDMEDYGPVDEPDRSTRPKCDCKQAGCPAGQKGAPGVPGNPGSQGVSGPDGHPGISAAVLELISSQRTNCVLCPAGPPGNKGNRGVTGWRGLAGYRGVAGIPGRHGFHGKPGEAGDAGREGEAGKPGEKGSHGSDAHAIVGLPGKKGSPGSPGLAGAPGGRGYDSSAFGNPGIRGPVGQPGAAGVAGRKGPEGAPGPRGKRGERFCECGLVQTTHTRKVASPATEEEREIRKSPVPKRINIAKNSLPPYPQIVLVQHGDDLFEKNVEGPRGYNQSGLVNVNMAMAEKKKENEQKLQEILQNDEKVGRIVDLKENSKVDKEPFSHYYQLRPSTSTATSTPLLPNSSYQPNEADQLNYFAQNGKPRKEKAKKRKSTGRKHGSATVRAPPIKIHSRRKVFRMKEPNTAETLVDREAKRVITEAIEATLEARKEQQARKEVLSAPSENSPLLEKIARILAASRTHSPVPIERPIRRSPISTGSSTTPSVQLHKATVGTSMNSRREPLSYANIKLQHNIPPRVLQRHLEHMRNKFSIGMIDNDT